MLPCRSGRSPSIHHLVVSSGHSPMSHRLVIPSKGAKITSTWKNKCGYHKSKTKHSRGDSPNKCHRHAKHMVWQRIVSWYVSISIEHKQRNHGDKHLPHGHIKYSQIAQWKVYGRHRKYSQHQKNEVSKNMGQVQDNPSIMCIWCSEDIMALNTKEGAIVQYVWGNQVNHVTNNGTWHMWSDDIVATKHMRGASDPKIGCNTQDIYIMMHGSVKSTSRSKISNMCAIK